MIQLIVTKTGKSYSPKDKWQIFDHETLSFQDMKQAREYIKEEYGKSKRSSMYVDTKDGKSKRIGYVIGFRNEDCSHYPINRWIQQDWVEFREVKIVEI